MRNRDAGATPGRTVLIVAHGHPEDRLGGAENCATFLFDGLDQGSRYHPWLVAGADEAPHANTRWSRAASHERHLIVAPGDYDPFWGRLRDRGAGPREWVPLLEALRPDIVHFHHVQGLGYDVLRITRQHLPHAPIVLTLHDYHAICAVHDLVKRPSGQLCWSASPLACHRCAPAASSGVHHVRRLWIRDNLEHVTRFVSPSSFLRDRYVEWGLPAEKIDVLENGRARPEPEVREPTRRPRNRFGYFGQLSRAKGLLTLLRAARLLHVRGAPIDLAIHGTNLERQDPEFGAAFRRELDACPPSVSMHPAYGARRVHELMRSVDWVIVPSEWWENSPLVIQEAFACGRPVLCSDIGGMREKVRDGVDGLHFPAGDAAGLAAAMVRAATEEGLWDRLSGATVAPPDMAKTAEAHADLYDSLLGAEAGR